MTNPLKANPKHRRVKTPAGRTTRLLRKAGILLFWLLIWQLLSFIINNDILFAGPLAVIQALFGQIGSGLFWKSLAGSSVRICLGFLSAFFSGIFLGALSYRSGFIRELLSPILLLLKSIPVASFVILALIWIGSKNLSVFISFTVVLPMLYTATLSGLESADRELLEMAQVFRMPFMSRIRGIYLPALMPYLISSVSTALGLSIKSGVAAEVIGVPDFSIGSQLYMAKIYLDTANLFAWTAVILLITFLFERLFLLLLSLLNPVKTESAASPEPPGKMPGKPAADSLLTDSGGKEDSR